MRTAAPLVLALFLQAFAAPASISDSLVFEIRNDYLCCTGDTTSIPVDSLLKWKAFIDSVLALKSNSELTRSYLSFTGLKARDIKPCEPFYWYQQFELQLKEMDSLISQQRSLKEKAYLDSLKAIREIDSCKQDKADLLGIPHGISKETFKWVFRRNNSSTLEQTPDFFRADSIFIDSLCLTAAFHFDQNGKYSGYELQTFSVPADSLNSLVRSWAARLSSFYEELLELKPDKTFNIGFHDIKQGKLSIWHQWDKGNKILVGLATHNNRYYAKVIVKY